MIPRRSRWRRLATGLLGALLVVGGGIPAAATAAPVTDVVAGPATDPTAGCPATTLARMSLAQRVGHLLMLGIGGTLEPSEASAIQALHLGSVTFSARVTGGRSAVSAISAAVQTLATPAATGGVRYLVAANQESGLVQALSGPGFATIPTAVEQGRLAPRVLTGRARTWGTQLRLAGVNVDLAPVGDIVPRAWESINQPIGRLHRQFGRGPSVVASHVAAFLAGMDDAGVATTVKHFPGLGRVTGNTDFVAGVKDRLTTRHDPFLVPFRRAVEGGAPFVMASLATYTRIDPDRIGAFSPTIITGMLRDDLGFTGVVMSDDLSAVAVRSIKPGVRATRFLAAGGDLIVTTSLSDARAMARRLLARAEASPAFAERVDQSVLRILRAKDALGLLACG